jgi:hypothetical protein
MSAVCQVTGRKLAIDKRGAESVVARLRAKGQKI